MEMLELLAANEELISNLYTSYADRFPEHKDFWQGLAIDEIKHAKWLRAIDAQHTRGRMEVDVKRFNKEAIKTYHQYLKEEISKVSNDLPLKVALTTSLYIEKSLIEQKYFEVLTGDSAKVRKTLANLEEATKDHINRVQKAWSEQ